MRFQEKLDKEEKKMMRSVFWRSWTMNASRTWSNEYHAVGVIYMLLPVINRFIKQKKNVQRQLFAIQPGSNATMHINNFIMGLVASNGKSKIVKMNILTPVQSLLLKHH